MIDNIFAFVLITAGWALALREYLVGRRRDWSLLALGTLVALATVGLAVWDLVANLGRRGDLAISLSMMVFVAWLTVVGWRYIRPGSWP
jgi:hypothetical protein